MNEPLMYQIGDTVTFTEGIVFHPANTVETNKGYFVVGVNMYGLPLVIGEDGAVCGVRPRYKSKVKRIKSAQVEFDELRNELESRKRYEAFLLKSSQAGEYVEDDKTFEWFCETQKPVQTA